GADVAPADVGWDDADLRFTGLFGGTFEDCVIHGNVFEFGIDSAEFLLVQASADRGGEFFELGVSFWKMTLEIVEESRDTPEEHSGVPLIVATGNVFLRESQCRFFREAPDRVSRKVTRGNGLAHEFDIAEAGFGACRRNAEDDHAVGFARDVECGGDGAAIFFRLRDELGRREDGQERIACCSMADVNCGECDGSGGVTADGFGKNAFARGSGQLPLKCGSLLCVGDAPDSVGRNEWTKALDGLLKHGLFADDVEKLLGSARSAARPETSAATSSEDDGVGS